MLAALCVVAEPLDLTPSGAQEAGSVLRLASQTPWVAPGDELVLRLGVTTAQPREDVELAVSVYRRVRNRSEFSRTLADGPRGNPITTTPATTLGVKEVLALPRAELEQRFALSGLEGLDVEILGGTGSVAGGGFLYTNLDTIAVGVVLHLPGLAASGRRPEDHVADLKAHPAIAPLVAGGELKEYSAHLIPEGGYDAMPDVAADGLLVAGDAAGLCLAAGLWLEGVNYAIGSGIAAGEAGSEALRSGDTSAAGLAGYRRRLEAGFVLKDHKKLRRAPHLVLSERMQRRYPKALCDIAEGLFTVENPRPKRGAAAIARQVAKQEAIRLRDLAKDLWAIGRTFG